MAWSKAKSAQNIRFHVFVLSAFLPIAANLSLALPVCAQNSQQGPLTPPPDHNVRRETNEATPDVPLALPQEEVVRRFSAKEDANLAARGHYGFRKTLRIQEFDPDGKPSGELLRVTEVVAGNDGRLAARIVENPQSTLKHIYLVPEDLAAFDRVPAFPLITSQLAKYDLKYLGKEQVDEINCYIFQVKPKVVERTRGLFDGLVWVDAQYLDIVKTYGKWMTELGEQRALEQLPFTLFETYRENVDGKYWLPNYTRSDDTLHLKEGDFPMRITIKWTDFKPIPTAPPAAVPAAASSPATPAKP
jgi:hypothetical protein